MTDARYFSADNIDYLKNKELDGYMAPSKDFKTEKFERDMNLRGFAAKVEPGIAALWHNLKLFKKLLMMKQTKIDLLGVNRMKYAVTAGEQQAA